MRALVLVGHFADFMDDIRPQSKILYPIDYAGSISKGINKENGSLREGCHLPESGFHSRMADLRRDGEEELASFGHLTFYPHVTLHKRNKTFGDRKTQSSTTIFLFPKSGYVEKKKKKE